jgi:hypothetical protein
MQPILVDDLLQLLSGERWLATCAAIFILAGALWTGGLLHKRRRSRAMFAALQSNTRGRVVAYRGPSAQGFIATVTPAPEPFREFSVNYRAMSILDPVDLMRRLFTGQADRLQVWAILRSSPAAEIIWAHGQAPGRALSHRPGRGLWVHYRLDISGGEFAARGANTNALCHAFREMHARLGPLLQRLLIQREGAPQVELLLSGSGLDTRAVPVVLTTLRSTGRAAMLG